jgi:hypothetical protein
MKKHNTKGKHLNMTNSEQMSQRLANLSGQHLIKEHLEHFMDQGSRSIPVSNQALGMEHGCLPQLMNQGKGTQRPDQHPMGKGDNPFHLRKLMGQG